MTQHVFLRSAWRALPPIAFALVAGLVWELAVRGLGVREFLLPPPSRIFAECVDKRADIFDASVATAFAAMCGLTASLILAFITACVFSRSWVVRTSLNPYAICLQTTPIITIAPLLIIWLGEGLVSVIAIAFIISFFPILTATTTGLMNVPQGLHDVFRLYRARWWHVLWKLQVPNALPYLVSGLKTSGGLAVLGAIVGDFFAGYSDQQSGLGYLVYQYKDYNTPAMFGCIAVATSLGLAFFFGISTIGDRVLLRWSDRKIGGF